MKLATLLSLVLLITACSHSVHNLEVEPKLLSAISDETKIKCGKKCELQKCWWETPNFLVCDVAFSFVTDQSKFKILESTSKDLEKKDIFVGFCGRDSLGTSLTAAFIGGLVIVALSSATNSTPSYAVVGGSLGAKNAYIVTTDQKEADLVKNACSSPPIVRDKPHSYN